MKGLKMTKSERRIYLIGELLKEKEGTRDDGIPRSEEGTEDIAEEPHEHGRTRRDQYFFPLHPGRIPQRGDRGKGIVDASLLPLIGKGISLWQGDITLLRCDAVVNAADSGMTGCCTPDYRCIDNCIHTYAGIELILKC